MLREVELQYNVYVSTFFSRPYIDLVDKSHAKDYFAKMKQLWQDHDLLIVEGKYSRSGEGMTCFLMLDQLVDSFVRQLMHIVANKSLPSPERLYLPSTIKRSRSCQSYFILAK